MDHTLVFREVDRDKFEEVRERRKTIETRAATERYRTIKPGDSISFKCGQDEIKKRVAEVKKYPTVEAMFEQLDPSSIKPGAQSADEILEMYRSFPRYTEKISKYGLIALKLTD